MPSCRPVSFSERTVFHRVGRSVSLSVGQSVGWLVCHEHNYLRSSCVEVMPHTSCNLWQFWISILPCCISVIFLWHYKLYATVMTNCTVHSFLMRKINFSRMNFFLCVCVRACGRVRVRARACVCVRARVCACARARKNIILTS